jgi:hypothetical protein
MNRDGEGEGGRGRREERSSSGRIYKVEKQARSSFYQNTYLHESGVADVSADIMHGTAMVLGGGGGG